MSELIESVFPDLDEHVLDPDPIAQFKMWFADAVKARVPQVDAMALATAAANGMPSARMVLLKSVDEWGFVFYTNYDSRKGRELARHQHAALLFFWAELSRQIRVEGTVIRVSPEESDAYFATRPLDGQLSSLVSTQSEPIGSRSELDRRFDEAKRQYEGKPIARPSHWGGFRVQPETIEFWQSRFARLNDRVLYTRHEKNQWKKTRLQP